MALLLSVVWHPLFIPPLLFGALWAYAPTVFTPLTAKSVQNLFFMVLILSMLLPTMVLGLMYSFGYIDNMHIPDRRQRIYPFFVISTFYIMQAWYMAFQLNINPIINALYIGVAILVASISVGTLFFKVSAHAAGAAGLAGFLFAIYSHHAQAGLFMPTLIAIVLGSAVMSSRLYLQAHSPKEILYGTLLGLGASIGCIYLLS